MVFCLVGRKKYSDAKDGYFTQDLCWTGLQLYSLERNLSQVRFNFYVKKSTFIQYKPAALALLIACRLAVGIVCGSSLFHIVSY